MSRMTKAQKEERTDAVMKLRKMLKPGDTVYTILRNVSRSGMSREISVVLLSPDEKPGRPVVDLHPNWLVATALGRRQGKREGIIVGGCGMDMGFALVHELSEVLYPKGFGCVGEACPSNDHSNGDRDYTVHPTCPRPGCARPLTVLSGPSFGCPVHGIVACPVEALERPCPACGGKGTTERLRFGDGGTTVEDCRTCHGKGKVGPGHWHRSGGYALRHRWI